MTPKLHPSLAALTLAVSLFALTPQSPAQEAAESGGLPPVLKAADLKGNNDGKIQREELPANLQRFFEDTDINADRVLTWQEVDEAKAKRFADLPRLMDVIGALDAKTLDLLGGAEYEVGWVEGVLTDASRKREIGYLIRYPKERDGLVPIVLLSQGGYGNSFGQYAYTGLATAYARLGFLAVNIVNGDQAATRLLSLNTALFFHTYLRGGTGREKIGTLAWIEGWTLERKIQKIASASTQTKP